jgi:hypothetical protein
MGERDDLWCCVFFVRGAGWLWRVFFVLLRTAIVLVVTGACKKYTIPLKSKKQPIFSLQVCSAPFGTLRAQCSKRSTSLELSMCPANSNVVRSTKSAVLLLEHCTFSAPHLSFLLFFSRHLIRNMSNAGMSACEPARHHPRQAEKRQKQHHKTIHSLLGDARPASKEVGRPPRPHRRRGS